MCFFGCLFGSFSPFEFNSVKPSFFSHFVRIRTLRPLNSTAAALGWLLVHIHCTLSFILPLLFIRLVYWFRFSSFDLSFRSVSEFHLHTLLHDVVSIPFVLKPEQFFETPSLPSDAIFGFYSQNKSSNKTQAPITMYISRDNTIRYETPISAILTLRSVQLAICPLQFGSENFHMAFIYSFRWCQQFPWSSKPFQPPFVLLIFKPNFFFFF